jgi:hypothetical protein
LLESVSLPKTVVAVVVPPFYHHEVGFGSGGCSFIGATWFYVLML